VKSSQGEVVTRWTRHKSEKTRQWTRHLWRVHRVTSSLAPDSTTRDLMLIQHNKFYWISNRSGVAELS